MTELTEERKWQLEALFLNGKIQSMFCRDPAERDYVQSLEMAWARQGNCPPDIWRRLAERFEND